MSVIIRCSNPSCQRINRYDESLAGHPVHCPICGERRILTLEAEGTSTTVAQRLSGRSGSAETLELTTLAEGAERKTGSARTVPLKIGRYQIRREIGSGAFGSVFCAYDPKLDRDVALKVPHPGVLESPSAIERFLREARAAGRLRHGHIVPVFDTGQDEEGHYYIASAYVPGSTLADLLIEGPLPMRRAVEFVRDLAGALQHAHDSGVVHRDIKPSNVLIDAHGTALLADFGLAQQRGPSSATITELGTVMGTPGYMAPEIATGVIGDVPPASDQYSLGVVLYELLSGQRPFQGPSHVVIYRKIEQDAPSLRQLRPDVPETLESISLRALNRCPEDRFPTIGDFGIALQDWLDSREADGSREPPDVTLDTMLTSVEAPVPGAMASLSGRQTPVRRRWRPRLGRVPGPVWMALVTLAVWGAIILGVVVFIRGLLPES